MSERAVRYTIYTDGGADPNPGPGGWGAVVLEEGGATREMSGSAPEATNNRMELTAALEVLRSLPDGASVDLHTDSTYLRNGITQWMPNWIRRGWQRKGGALANVDLWQALAVETRRHAIRWHWVKGHAGNRHNERADALASAAIPGRVPVKDVADPAGPDPDVEVFLTVSCDRGRGAWAAIVRTRDGAEEVLDDARRGTTAPQLEVLGAGAVLASLQDPGVVAIHTPSDYLRNGATRWIHGWKRGGWRTKSGQPVKNRAAWEALDLQLRRHRVQWPVDKSGRPDEAKALDQHLRRRLEGAG